MSGSEVAIPAPVSMLRSYQPAIAQILPSHLGPDTFLRVVESVLRKDDKLMAAAVRDPGAFMAACMDAARLGHEPGTDHYALTVRSGRIMGIEQYQGVIERMYRAGGVTAVHAHVIRANDEFQWMPPGPPVHRANWLATDEERGALAGVYAYAQLVTGGWSRVVVMNRDEVMRHRAVAATTNIWDGPFQPSMWLKTAAHELEKWVPTSAEYRNVMLKNHAQIAATGLPDPVPTVVYPDAPPALTDDVDTVSGVVVDDDWPEPAKPGEATK